MRKITTIIGIVGFVFCLFLVGCYQIPRKEGDFNEFEFIDKEVIYDGTEYFIEVDGELPEGVTVRYENNGHSDAGKYEVKAIFEGENEFYDLPFEKTATLTIHKKHVSVRFNDENIEYDGNIHSLKVYGLPSGVEVEYENNDQTEIGTYEVRAKITDPTGNYQIIKHLSATLNITKKQLRTVDFDSKIVVYDGEEHFLEVTGLPEGVSVRYENNGHTNAGYYEVLAYFTDSTGLYDVTSPLYSTLYIQRALVEVKFNNAIYEYTGTPIKHEVEGELPEGVSYTYTNNEHTEPGRYLVKAKFNGNENYYGWDYDAHMFIIDPATELIVDKGGSFFGKTDIYAYNLTYVTDDVNVVFPDYIRDTDGKLYVVTSLSYIAYSNNKKVESIKFSKYIESIALDLSNATNLKTIDLGLGLTELDPTTAHTLVSCKSLETLIINKNITSIWGTGIENSTIKNVYYNGTIEDWKDIYIQSIYANPLYTAEHFYVLDADGNYYEYTDLDSLK